MKHHIIYVPGLGDGRSYGQPLLLRLWRLHGLTPHYHRFNWADQQPFQTKLEQLLKRIDSLKTANYKVSLVGVSAGASAVLTAYQLRPDKITGVVCISGKIQNGGTVGRQIYEHNPAFKQSMAGLPAVLDKLGKPETRRIMSIHPLKDSTVPPADTIILGAREKPVPVSGHIRSIFYCLLFCPLPISRFLSKL